MSTEREILARLGVKPSKERGQNFLTDLGALDSITLFGRPQANETLIEIGPGLGALTAELYAANKQLTLIEIEERFCEHLKTRFPEATILNEDVRFVDFADFPQRVTVFGNLPYSFSTDIITLLVQNAQYVKRAVVLLQKEFAQRLFAEPDTKAYGSLSVYCQLWSNVIPGPIITGDCFYPPPDVESQVVELRFLDKPRAKVDDFFTFQRVISAAFGKRRKKILNSMNLSGAFAGYDLSLAFRAADVSPDTRAEDLNIAELARLANSVFKLVQK